LPLFVLLFLEMWNSSIKILRRPLQHWRVITRKQAVIATGNQIAVRLFWSSKASETQEAIERAEESVNSEWMNVVEDLQYRIIKEHREGSDASVSELVGITVPGT